MWNMNDWKRFAASKQLMYISASSFLLMLLLNSNYLIESIPLLTSQSTSDFNFNWISFLTMREGSIALVIRAKHFYIISAVEHIEFYPFLIHGTGTTLMVLMVMIKSSKKRNWLIIKAGKDCCLDPSSRTDFYSFFRNINLKTHYLF